MLVFVLIGILAAGCAKQKKPGNKTSASKPVASRHEARGEVQNSGCKEDLAGIFMISRATLPHGAAAPSTNMEGRVGFIVGKAGTLLKTADGGLTWRQVLTKKPAALDLERILFMSTNEGWAIGPEQLLHSADCGETWTPAPELPEKFYYFGPSAASASAYYQMQPPTCGASVWRTPPGSIIWKSLPSHLPRNDYGAVFFYNDNLGWVAGNYGIFARTENGGQTWQTRPLEDAGRICQIQFVSPVTGWMRANLGHNGNIFYSNDGGASWQNKNINSIRPYWNINDMQFLDEKTGFLLVHVESGKNQVMQTRDGGSSWKVLGTHLLEISAFCFISPAEGWVIGAGGETFHYRP